jgi:hypothetical protein
MLARRNPTVLITSGNRKSRAVAHCEASAVPPLLEKPVVSDCLVSFIRCTCDCENQEEGDGGKFIHVTPSRSTRILSLLHFRSLYGEMRFTRGRSCWCEKDA